MQNTTNKHAGNLKETAEADGHPATIPVYRNNAGQIYLAPGKGRQRLHPDDSIALRTEIHVFHTAKEAKAFEAGVDACSEMLEETVMAGLCRYKKKHAVIVEGLYRVHEEREIPVTFHD